MHAHDSNTSLKQRLAEGLQTFKRHYPYVDQYYLLFGFISSVIQPEPDIVASRTDVHYLSLQRVTDGRRGLLNY